MHRHILWCTCRQPLAYVAQFSGIQKVLALPRNSPPMIMLQQKTLHMHAAGCEETCRQQSASKLTNRWRKTSKATNKDSENRTHANSAVKDALAVRRAAVALTAPANLARELRLLQQCPSTRKLPRVRASSSALCSPGVDGYRSCKSKIANLLQVGYQLQHSSCTCETPSTYCIWNKHMAG